ncbi:MAG: DNA repair protein RecN [Ruminococcaceae bacterium]|nr:DNA repair protein RecN [Oscillospiraceae bacterium]
MLKYLHIENIAVIERAGIEFTDGFNVLTGETGAGKSIIIDSLYAVLGFRTSKELIRNGCENAFVSAVFSFDSNELLELFSEIGVKQDDDGNFVIERKLSVSGSGYIKINGVPVSASTLKNFSPYLLNIHGQHDNQTLLNPDNHYLYIDMIADNDEILSKYRQEFTNFNSIRSRLKSLEMDEDEKLRKIDVLKYQINEISEADLKIGEIEELKEKLSVARSVGKRIKDIKSVLSLLKNDDENGGACEALKTAVHLLSVMDDKKSEKDYSFLLDALENVNNVVSSLEGYVEELNGDGYDVNFIEDRLAVISTLSAKYGKDETEIFEFLEKAQIELNSILFNDEEYEKLENELEISQERLIKFAEKLTSSRIKAASVFEKKVKDVLACLNMPNVCLKVERSMGRYNKNGCDEIQFIFSANAGEDSKPLSKIASGGELSRVMLAIKSVLSEKDNVDTLIFDEIDSGISGRTADMVGVQLKKVATSHQVICVTHLAQIAVAAKTHLLIEKAEKDGRTYTDITSVSGEERVYEIARIMSGSNVSDNVLASARELLKM